MAAIKKPTEKGITPPSGLEIDNMPKFKKWLHTFQLSYPKIRTAQVTLDPASVSANSESAQTFTITGLTLNDIVTVNKPTQTANLWILQAFVSAADTLTIVFYNNSGGAIDPASEDYLITATRL